MFKNNFIVNVKVNGEILRERDGIVYLPFGSNYSIFLKNLENRDASVKISIDGEDVIDGNSWCIKENCYADIDGFLKGTVITNRFLFTQKTKEIVDYRGDKSDDGILRIEVWYEKRKIPSVNYVPSVWTYPVYPPNVNQHTYTTYEKTSDNMAYKIDASYNAEPNILRSMNQSYCSCSLDNIPLNDEGITVKGQKIHQQHTTVCMNSLEEVSTVFVIQLKGIMQKKTEIVKPLIVSDKLICSTCGRSWKSDIKYCGNCGTCLLI